MTVLVFGGSGILYPVHLGAAQYLIDEKVISIDDLETCGTSGGSIVAAIMANGISPKDGKEISKKFLPRDIVKMNWKLWQPPRGMGLFSLDKLEEILRKFVPKTFADSQHPLTVVCNSADKQKTVFFSSECSPEQDVAAAVHGSASVPFLFTPKEIAGELFNDGGVSDNLAVDYAGFKGKEIIGIRLLSGSGDNPPLVTSRLKYVQSVLGSMMGTIEREHIEDAHYANVVSIKVPYHPFDIFRIGKEEIDDMYNIGYKAMEEKLTQARQRSGGSSAGLIWH